MQFGLFLYFLLTSALSGNLLVITSNLQKNYCLQEIKTRNCTCNNKAPVFASYKFFEYVDKLYGLKNKYIKKINNIPQLRYLSNEKVCFHRLAPYELNPIHMKSCFSYSDMLFFFSKNKKDLLFRCHDNTTFSHCQEFFVMIYDSSKNLCSSFQRKPC